ncbi:MAG: restriction endonuclease [Bacteroidetes bacterium]|nr:restriction endonuclease [Bacteroidota bacterium]
MKRTLFEFDKWVKIENSTTLSHMLKSIWRQRNFTDLTDELEEDETDKNYQPFLRISNNEIRANNYVGFIQTANDLVEIYPKVFRNSPEKDKNDMLRHIFFWLNYCSKWKFPFSQAQLDRFSIDEFPELIINLIANQFLETVSNQPFTMYQPVEDVMQTPRGSINFKRYIANSLVSGNFQNIECDYEPFLLDNKVNRVIKYCSRLLMNQTKFAENIQMLQEVVFILDEVEDIPCNSYEVENITLNSFFEDYNKVLDSCKLILNQQIYSNNSYDLSQWCLLFPMEYIFEDFVAGFLADKISNDWKVEYQKSNEYLSSNPKAFNMQHDIFLTSRSADRRKVIIDTKYKLRSFDFKNDIKKGIAQADLYQMTSYAFRRGCTDILLLYPNITEDLNVPDIFEITSGYNISDKITITAMEIPFWTTEKLDIMKLEIKLFNILKTQLDKLKI